MSRRTWPRELQDRIATFVAPLIYFFLFSTQLVSFSPFSWSLLTPNSCVCEADKGAIPLPGLDMLFPKVSASDLASAFLESQSEPESVKQRRAEEYSSFQRRWGAITILFYSYSLLGKERQWVRWYYEFRSAHFFFFSSASFWSYQMFDCFFAPFSRTFVEIHWVTVASLSTSEKWEQSGKDFSFLKLAFPVSWGLRQLLAGCYSGAGAEADVKNIKP